MKPFSTHWADIAASRIVKERGDKETYVVASGITPSGLVHVGNFREAITVDLVARALRSINKKVRFIYSWDNFDTFRKVPKNLPDPQGFEPYLKQPIARIPDPWGKASSYAKGRMDLFEGELKEVGIYPFYLYQEELYGKGTYAPLIRHVLERVDTVKSILNAHRTSPLEEGWLPTSVYCSKCQKDEMDWERYEGGWNYSYHCQSCGNEETFDMRQSKNLKLIWRLDWPMRWFYEKVDFEPGGKDHSSQGGSFDTGKELVAALWDHQPPIYLQYDFVMIKGGTGKMSSSSGQLFTLSEVLEVYEPQIVRWIFASQKPNHDFSLAFDEDVIKIYDEFDRAEQQALNPSDNSSKWQITRRAYELSLVEEGSLPSKPPVRASFRLLCNRLQICSHDAQRTFEKFYADQIHTEADRKAFFMRCEKASNWLKLHAPEEFCYALHEEKIQRDLNPQQKAALLGLVNLIKQIDLDKMEAKELNELIWKHMIHESGIDAKEAFSLVYQSLIGRDQGPRLPSFLKEIGRERLLVLL